MMIHAIHCNLVHKLPLWVAKCQYWQYWSYIYLVSD